VRLRSIQHLKTPVRGTLAGTPDVLPVVAALHPTPAMGGSPRAAALRLIAREEPFERGWYAAPVGWLAGETDGQFLVAIRSAVSDGRSVQLFAGAGIVRDSDPDREWAEVQLKFRPLLDALGAGGVPA
jgi:menaquinone-specific isochorismate synthase